MQQLNKYALILVVLMSLWVCGAQNIQTQRPLDYPKKLIRNMTSPRMHGRGYVNQGDRIAAEFIAKQFRMNEVKHFGESYFQEYTIDVNTFPGEVFLSINGDTLNAGYDYLIQAESNDGQDSGKVINVAAADIQDAQRFGDKYRMIREGKASIVYLNTLAFSNPDSLKMMRGLAYELAQTCAVITTVKNKLTWSVGRDTARFPIFQIIDSMAPTIIESASYHVDQEYVTGYKTQNVVGFITGRDKKLRDDYVVFTAHYDHLGRMGKDVYFPGANDNASGTAMLMTLARFYSRKPPRRTVVFIAFSGEEAGLEGSKYFVEHPLFKLKKIRFLLNLDIFGSGDDGITVVNAKKHQEEFDLLNKINDERKAVPRIKSRKESYNSDHYPFTLEGVPAWFIYTVGEAKQYHDPDDLLRTLNLNHFIPLRNLLIQFERELG